MLYVNLSGLLFTRKILTKIVLAEAEVITNWQRQRLAEAEMEKPHFKTREE